jgi:hypothetical protein
MLQTDLVVTTTKLLSRRELLAQPLSLPVRTPSTRAARRRALEVRVDA